MRLDAPNSPLRLERDVSAADWIVRSVRDFEFDVGSLVPTCFGAYGRVLHPAYVGDREVRWADVAAANGRLAHPAMDWISITGSWRFLHDDQQQDLWDAEPSEGSLPIRQNRRLVSVLEPHTSTPESCCFALWGGFGDLEPPDPPPPLVPMPQREMYLFSGPIQAWLARQASDFWEHSPSLWWPQDRAWCVATDVDLMCTYLGATEACIEAVVGDDELEAMRVSVNQDISCEQDTLNPAASDPPPWLNG